jgi:hypothetical protein
MTARETESQRVARILYPDAFQLELCEHCGEPVGRDGECHEPDCLMSVAPDAWAVAS